MSDFATNRMLRLLANLSTTRLYSGSALPINLKGIPNRSNHLSIKSIKIIPIFLKQCLHCKCSGGLFFRLGCILPDASLLPYASSLMPSPRCLLADASSQMHPQLPPDSSHQMHRPTCFFPEAVSQLFCTNRCLGSRAGVMNCFWKYQKWKATKIKVKRSGQRIQIHTT